MQGSTAQEALLKKSQKSFTNPIDNHAIVWYNQITIQVIPLDESAYLKGGNRMILENAVLMLTGVDWTSFLVPLAWFGVIVLTLVIESQTADLISIWFAPGAFVALILSFFEVVFWVQLAVFIGVTVIGMILSFSVFRPMMKKRNKVEKTNTDAMVGKLALVEEDVNNNIPTGVAKINGQLWTARMEDPAATAVKGDWVEIVRVEGSKLICRSKS